MKNKRIITVLSILILDLSLVAVLAGLMPGSQHSYPDITTVFGETIKLCNQGLYGRDSFVIPASFVAAYLLLKRNRWGCLLSMVLMTKAMTMTSAVSVMAFNMKLHGVEVSIVEMMVFPAITFVGAGFVVWIFGRMGKVAKA